jgi:cell division protein FtsB
LKWGIVTSKLSLRQIAWQVTFLNLILVALTKANFSYAYCIGKGGFGKVWKVERKKTKQPYAMKEMSKARIITKRSVKSVINER